MFGKKNKTPYQVIVLTSNYFIEGENNPADDNDVFNDGIRFDFGTANETGNLYGGINLQSVKVSPTRWVGEVTKFNNWMIGGADNVVAVIPMDANALAICKDTFEDFSAIGEGVILASAYTIRGTIMTEDDSDKKGSIVSETGFFVVQNAIISNKANEKMKDINVELVVVNGRFVDGYTLE